MNQPSKKAKRQKVAPPVERRSFKLKRADWFWLQELAMDTGSLYKGKASWRRLVARIARGELVVTVPALLPSEDLLRIHAATEKRLRKQVQRGFAKP